MNYRKSLSYSFLIVCIFLFIFSWWISSRIFSSNLINNKVSESANSFRRDTTEFALTYFGCSTCTAATDKDLPDLISKVSIILKESLADKQFTTIGISNESNYEQGVNYLQSILPFDEISVGNQMRNTAIQKFIWGKYEGEYSASTPQVLISRRIFHHSIIGNDTIISPEIKSEEILIRQIGISNIKKLKDSSYLSRILNEK